MSSAVSRPPAANSDSALAYFQSIMGFETDCWDVHHAISHKRQDFVLLDVRTAEAFNKGHIEAAINLPYSQLTPDKLKQYPADSLFVVYCAGPHCNAADKAAIRLAKMQRPVKKMTGGICGWLDEGFALDTSKKPKSNLWLLCPRGHWDK